MRQPNPILITVCGLPIRLSPTLVGLAEMKRVHAWLGRCIAWKASQDKTDG